MYEQPSSTLSSRWNQQLKHEALDGGLFIHDVKTLASIPSSADPHSPVDKPTCAASDSLVVADGCDPSIQELLKETQSETYFINENEDAIQAITHLIKAQEKKGRRVDTLHIVAHGNPNSIKLGSKPITAEELQNNEHLTSQWPVNNIALWSCEAAKNNELIEALCCQTEANIYASKTRICKHRPLIYPSNYSRTQPSSTALSLQSITREGTLQE